MFGDTYNWQEVKALLSSTVKDKDGSKINVLKSTRQDDAIDEIQTDEFKEKF